MNKNGVNRTIIIMCTDPKTSTNEFLLINNDTFKNM